MDKNDILQMIDEREHLAHYGIKGQKHGVRRWQNEDGSLTPEGYRHYGIDPNRQKANLSVSGLQMARYKKDIFNKTYSDSRSSGLNRSESIKKAKEISDKELDRVYGTRTQDFRRDPGLFKQYPIYKSEYAEERDSKSINAPKNFKILDNNLNKNSDNKTDQDRIKKEIEFKKINESAEDFYKKKAEQHDKYEAMSAIGSCLSFNESIGIEPSVRDMLNEIYGYKHEDGDQGNYSSLTFYTVDNNLEEEYEKLKKEASPFFRDLSFNSDAWTQGLNELFLSDLYNENEIKEYASKAKEIMSKFPGIENAEKVLDDSEYWDIPWSKLEPWQVAEINKKLSLAHSDNSDFLAHWGIKGQKWGKRRFQNEDGSLTPEGRKRYGVGEGENKTKTETKDYHEMSDQELSEALRRKRLENQYVNLKLGDPAKSKKEKIEFIKEAVSTTNKTIDLVDKTILESQRRDLNEEAERLREENRNNKDLSKEQRSANEEEIKYYEDAAKNINLSKDLVSQSMTSINAMVDLAGRKVIKKSKLNPEKVAEVAKDISEMSNDELQRQVNRMLMEKQYDQLMNPPKESNWVKGREVLQTIGSVIGIVGGTAGIVWTSMKIAEMVGKVAHDDMNDDVLTHYAMMGEDFLAHYGVKGQKRGIRRWQNEDGSLTPEGYRHYGIDPNTGRGENIVTSRQIERYRKDIYKDSYRKAREEGYNRQQSKAQAISNRALESVKAYGAGRLAERDARIAKAEAKSGLAGIGLGMVGGGALGAKVNKDDGEMGVNIGMLLGSSAGGITGSMLGGELAKRFGKYENKNIKSVDEIDKILINTREMTQDEAIDAVEKYIKKTADEYSNKYMDLLDKNYMINEKSEDVKRLRKEYQYVLNTVGAAFGTNYLLYLARTMSDEFDKKKKEKMKEEMSGTQKVGRVLNKAVEKIKQDGEEQKRYNEARTRQDERANTGSRDPIQEAKDRIEVGNTRNRLWREDRYQEERRRRNRGNI